LLFVTTLLGLEPGENGFESTPNLPAGITRIELKGASSRRPAAKPGPAPVRIDVAIAPSDGPVNGLRAADIFARLEDIFDPAKTRGEHGSYRFEIVGVGSWAFAVDDGRIVRLAADDPVDCLLRMNEETFIKINTGQGNAMTAFFRGAVAFEGDLLLVSKLDKYTR